MVVLWLCCGYVAGVVQWVCSWSCVVDASTTHTVVGVLQK